MFSAVRLTHVKKNMLTDSIRIQADMNEVADLQAVCVNDLSVR